jgi:hypothetical protein
VCATPGSASLIDGSGGGGPVSVAAPAVTSTTASTSMRLGSGLLMLRGSAGDSNPEPHPAGLVGMGAVQRTQASSNSDAQCSGAGGPEPAQAPGVAPVFKPPLPLAVPVPGLAGDGVCGGGTQPGSLPVCGSDPQADGALPGCSRRRSLTPLRNRRLSISSGSGEVEDAVGVMGPMS